MVLIIGLLPALPIFTHADNLAEHFDRNPMADGWQTFGNSNLFHWNETNQNLEVTWDSRQPNSYLMRPLGTQISRSDNFSLEFDLNLSDIVAGIDPQKAFAMQIAVGFFNKKQATQPSFYRATGSDSPNVAEFDYFPDSGFGATISPTLISSNMMFATSFNVYQLSYDEMFHVKLSYNAANQTLTTQVTTNGSSFATIKDVVLSDTFSDFNVDTLSISSYSDAGQFPDWAGSVLAHGIIDNIAATFPPPPIRNMIGSLSPDGVAITFVGQTNWTYQLEQSPDFTQWSPASDVLPGANNSPMTITAPSQAEASKQFYRVRAIKQ
jgi:hypothetical protein